jgi:hypothetical protein
MEDGLPFEKPGISLRDEDIVSAYGNIGKIRITLTIFIKNYLILIP